MAALYKVIVALATELGSIGIEVFGLTNEHLGAILMLTSLGLYAWAGIGFYSGGVRQDVPTAVEPASRGPTDWEHKKILSVLHAMKFSGTRPPA